MKNYVTKIQLSKIIVPVALVLMIVLLSSTTLFAAQNSSINLESSKTSYDIGESVSVDVQVNAASNSASAVQARLVYDSSRLEIVSIDSSDSAFKAGIVTTASEGQIEISRYVTPIGSTVTGNSKLATLKFKSIASGNADIQVKFGSSIAAAGAQFWDGVENIISLNISNKITSNPTSLITSSSQNQYSAENEASSNTSRTVSDEEATGASLSAQTANPEEPVPVTNAELFNESFLVAVLVKDADGNSVENAEVELSDQKAVTDSTGVASFVGVESGIYIVKATDQNGNVVEDLITIDTANSELDIQDNLVTFTLSFEGEKTNYIPFIGVVLGILVVIIVIIAINKIKPRLNQSSNNGQDIDTIARVTSNKNNPSSKITDDYKPGVVISPKQ